MNADKVDVLVIDSGGRGHAIVDKLKYSPRAGKIYIAPGNDGIFQTESVEIVSYRPSQVIELVNFAISKKISMTFVGTEEALAAGIGDVFRAAKLPIVAPTSSASLIETSKIFVYRQFRDRLIPMPASDDFYDLDEALYYLNHPIDRPNSSLYSAMIKLPVVVKPDGLTGGKGVVRADTWEEAKLAVCSMMGNRVYKDAGDRVLLQKCENGRECSVIAAVSYRVEGGRKVPVVQLIDVVADYKPLNDGNTGPNTGSMGGYGPFKIDLELRHDIIETFLRRAAEVLIHQQRPFEGILYAGLMLTEDGPKLLEYNARFGDPEAQIILPRMKTDLLEVLFAIAEHRLHEIEIEMSPEEVAVCKVLAAKGYPTNPIKGKRIDGLEQASQIPGVKIYHAGTEKSSDGYWYTNGGRVLNVVARAQDFRTAKSLADQASACISFEDDTKHERTDIAAEVAI